jgi:hypothetical protein
MNSFKMILRYQIFFSERFPANHQVAILGIVLISFCISFQKATASEEHADDTKQPHKLPSQEEESKWAWQDPAPTKIIVSATAYTLPKKRLSLNFSTAGVLGISPFVFNFLDVSYGITKYLELNVSAYLPIFYLGFGVNPKFGFSISKYVQIGFMPSVIFVWDYMDQTSGPSTWTIYGGAPIILSFGNSNYFVNLSLHVHGSYMPEGYCLYSTDDCTETVSNHLILLPSIGAS